MRAVILRSSDGADHVVPSETACLSGTVQSLLEELEGEPAGPPFAWVSLVQRTGHG